jgi:hypothetical protein
MLAVSKRKGEKVEDGGLGVRATWIHPSGVLIHYSLICYSLISGSSCTRTLSSAGLRAATKPRSEKTCP